MPTLSVNEDGQFVITITDVFETRTHVLSRTESRERADALIAAQGPKAVSK